MGFVSGSGGLHRPQSTFFDLTMTPVSVAGDVNAGAALFAPFADASAEVAVDDKGAGNVVDLR